MLGSMAITTQFLPRERTSLTCQKDSSSGRYLNDLPYSTLQLCRPQREEESIDLIWVSGYDKPRWSQDGGNPWRDAGHAGGEVKSAVVI